MTFDRLENPVRVSFVLFDPQLKLGWELMAHRRASLSHVMRDAIRMIPLEAPMEMRRFFAQQEPRLKSSGPKRSSVVLDAKDLSKLDAIVVDSGAPSRSAAARFLLLHAYQSHHGRVSS